jgi:uncharacterized phage protein gp47/JayE
MFYYWEGKMGKSLSDIISSMISSIRGKNSKIDTSEGSLVNDIVIYAPSEELSQLYDVTTSISKDQSIDTATSSGIDVLAENIVLSRKAPRYAVGAISYFCNYAPSADITIPKDAVVSTKTSTSSPGIQFKTSVASTMYATIASSYLNSSTGKYEISIPIVAVSAGSNGNVGSQNISSIVTPISGVDGCYNPSATSGGGDLESDESLKSRIRSRWSGVAIGTSDGISDSCFLNSYVDDVNIVGHGDTGRDEICAVDVYVKGKKYTQQKDVFTYFTTNLQDCVLSKQPVAEDITIQVETSGSGSIPSNLWQLTKDYGNYGGSVKGGDTIHWLTNLPTSLHGSIYVIYSYNSLVEDLQSDFTKTNTDVLNTNLLVKHAREIKINVTMNIKVTTGYSSTDVVTTIQNNLAAFFNDFRMGQQVQQADVARVVLNTLGVDDVQLPFTYFRDEYFLATQDSFGNLDMPLNGYAAGGTITINVIS